jgi:hypothetical protein
MKSAEKVVLYLVIAVVVWMVVSAVTDAAQSTSSAANTVAEGAAGTMEMVGTILAMGAVALFL